MAEQIVSVPLVDVGLSGVVDVAGLVGGQEMQLRAVDLLGAVSALDPDVAIVFFLPSLDAPENSYVKAMVEQQRETASSVVIRSVPATDAVKRVHNGQVVESIDRSTLNLLRPPEIVSRESLLAALVATDDEMVNPAILVSSAGGDVAVIDLSASSGH